MLFNKNEYLFPQVKSISILPVVMGNSFLNNFEKVYSSPSKIRFKSSSNKSAAGLEYSTRIDLFYPGLNKLDFENFHDLLQQKYVVILETVDQEKYQVSFTETPFKLQTSFDDELGFTIVLSGKSFYNYRYVGTSSYTNTAGFAYNLTVRL